MARKFEIGPNYYAWHLEQCEEVAFTDFYLKVAPFIPPTETWKVELENHFYYHGNGLAQVYIDRLNAIARKHSIERFDLQETDISDYGRTNNKLYRAETRSRIRTEIQEATTDERTTRVTRAKAEMQALPPPHFTFEQFKARRDQYSSASKLSREEVSKRLVASQVAMVPPKPKTLPQSSAIKMLKHASPAMWPVVIGKLSPDDALDILDEIQDQEVRDKLIEHSLSAM